MQNNTNSTVNINLNPFQQQSMFTSMANPSSLLQPAYCDPATGTVWMMRPVAVVPLSKVNTVSSKLYESEK